LLVRMTTSICKSVPLEVEHFVFLAIVASLDI
jgi:hypothetical protein